MIDTYGGTGTHATTWTETARRVTTKKKKNFRRVSENDWKHKKSTEG
jgi:hypothetical protein